MRVALRSYSTSGHTVTLAFYVNARNSISQIDFRQLDAIYCTTLKPGATQRITHWVQLGVKSEWAQREIHLVGVTVPDGISNYIRLTVCKGGNFRPGIHEENTGETINVLDRIVSFVASDPEAIGYAGLLNRKSDAKEVAISESPSGP